MPVPDLVTTAPPAEFRRDRNVGIRALAGVLRGRVAPQRHPRRSRLARRRPAALGAPPCAGGWQDNSGVSNIVGNAVKAAHCLVVARGGVLRPVWAHSDLQWLLTGVGAVADPQELSSARDPVQPAVVVDLVGVGHRRLGVRVRLRVRLQVRARCAPRYLRRCDSAASAPGISWACRDGASDERARRTRRYLPCRSSQASGSLSRTGGRFRRR